MNYSKNFRKINNFERNMIHTSLLKISNDIIILLDKIRFELFIKLNNSNSQDIFPNIYLVPQELNEIISNIHIESEIKSSGLYFGMLKKGTFYISLEGAEFLHSHDCFPNKNIIQVNSEGEKSTFYGNHILKKNISYISPDLTKNDFLLIFNMSDEIIAIANSKVDYLESKGLENNEIIAFNLVDKGYYLRKQS